MDREKIEKAVRDILEAIGEDPDREGLAETPKRVAAMYEEIFSGLRDNPQKHIKVFSEKDVRKQVVKDVLLTMLDRMDRLTGCGVPYHIKKFINEIAAENGIELVKENEK